MSFVKTFFAAAAVGAVLILTTPLYAQDQTPMTEKASQTSITGCLAKIDNEHYEIVDSQTGMKLTVAAKPEFEKLAGHTVKMTGTASKDGKSFAAANVENVSDKCEAR